MVTLHSFDEEPTAGNDIYLVCHDYKIHEMHNNNDGTYFAYGSFFDNWASVKDEVLTDYKGWLYESELMQLIKNGTRSE